MVVASGCGGGRRKLLETYSEDRHSEVRDTFGTHLIEILN